MQDAAGEIVQIDVLNEDGKIRRGEDKESQLSILVGQMEKSLLPQAATLHGGILLGGQHIYAHAAAGTQILLPMFSALL